MTKISVVSTFHKPVLDLYGQRFVDSFSKNIDPQIELLLYAEDCTPVTDDPRIKIFNHHYCSIFNQLFSKKTILYSWN